MIADVTRIERIWHGFLLYFKERNPCQIRSIRVPLHQQTKILPF